MLCIKKLLSLVERMAKKTLLVAAQSLIIFVTQIITFTCLKTTTIFDFLVYVQCRQEHQLWLSTCVYLRVPLIAQ